MNINACTFRTTCLYLFLGVFLFLPTFWFGCLPKVKRVCKTTEQCDGFRVKHFCFKKGCIEAVCQPDPSMKHPQSCDASCDPKKETCKPSPKGACRSGVRYCIQNGKRWSSCFGAIAPSKEICDGKDNDCDGKTDEKLDCSCAPHDTRDCNGGMTQKQISSPNCQKGTQTCVQKGKKWLWGACTFLNQPSRINQVLSKEAIQTCHITDRNCDGNVDDEPLPSCSCKTEGKSRDCGRGNTTSPCQTGTQTCKKQKDNELRWGICIGAVLPKSEQASPCNGKDDDCDGKVDNQTGTALPMWKKCDDDCGISLCIDKTWSLCGKREMCGNKQDDDCDGQIDESDCVTK